jgi:hypothetical protein
MELNHFYFHHHRKDDDECAVSGILFTHAMSIIIRNRMIVLSTHTRYLEATDENCKIARVLSIYGTLYEN